MRKDEDYAFNSLLRSIEEEYGVRPVISSEPYGANRAPDYMLTIAGRSILVEVTQGGDGARIQQDPSTGKNVPVPMTDVRSYNEMLAKIRAEVRTWISAGETIILTFLSPLPSERRANIARIISGRLKTEYDAGNLSHEEPLRIRMPADTEICLEAKLTTFYRDRQNYSPVMNILAASMSASNMAWQCNLSFQAQYVLQEAGVKKHEKLKNLSGEKWLIVINTHPLLTPDIYVKAAKSLGFKNQNASKPGLFEFARVYLVNDSLAHCVFGGGSKPLGWWTR